MTEKLFGTDGIRAVAGEGPLSTENVFATGRALGKVLGSGGSKALLCRDTRRSGPSIRDALTAGLVEQGVDVLDAGVRPTPALPYLARAWDCRFGAVISASHNPMEYNGIKVFGADGGKVPDGVEARIEREILSPSGPKAPRTEGRIVPAPDGPDPYRAALVDMGRTHGVGGGHTIVLDCANGATFQDAPAVFEALGMRVVAINAEPDGENINRNCGALHPEDMASTVTRLGALAGVALDGDGDRAILADEKGALKDGDFVLAALARFLQAEGKLSGAGVVGTVMSNIGLEIVLGAAGITLHRTAVGDRNVAREMTKMGLAIGGEPSGHVIFKGPSGLLPGDGILTALRVIGAAISTGKALSDLAGTWRLSPQTLINVPLDGKLPFDEVEGLPARLAGIEGELGQEGRVVLRYSGTEPVARVMVEGRDAEQVEEYAREIAEILKKALGKISPLPV